MSSTDASASRPSHERRSHLQRLAILGGPLSRPVSGRRLFPLYGVLHHVGRRSGRAYATPVVMRRASGAMYVPLPFGERTDWLRNALAAGRVRATWNGRAWWLADPVVIDRSQADEGFAPAMRTLMRLAGIDQVVRFASSEEATKG